MHMLHHVSLPVADLKKAKAMYEAALAPLGYRVVFDSETFVGFGVEDHKDKFGLFASPYEIHSNRGLHIALSAPNRESVDKFHAAALAHGATDRGEPGPRERYGPHYYAAFIADVDGHHIEAVINEPS